MRSVVSSAVRSFSCSLSVSSSFLLLPSVLSPPCIVRHGMFVLVSCVLMDAPDPVGLSLQVPETFTRASCVLTPTRKANMRGTCSALSRFFQRMIPHARCTVGLQNWLIILVRPRHVVFLPRGSYLPLCSSHKHPRCASCSNLLTIPMCWLAAKVAPIRGRQTIMTCVFWLRHLSSLLACLEFQSVCSLSALRRQYFSALHSSANEISRQSSLTAKVVVRILAGAGHMFSIFSARRQFTRRVQHLALVALRVPECVCTFGASSANQRSVQILECGRRCWRR